MSEAEIDKERDDLIDELHGLIKAKARHQSHLHETPAAKVDKGGFHFCPGCRAIVLSRRLAELESSLDDHGPNGVDKTIGKLRERREIEA